MEHLLVGETLPELELPLTNGSQLRLDQLTGTNVLYIYPRTSPADGSTLDGWDKIKGARGCTLQSRGFASFHGAILAAGARQVYGLSSQNSAYQKEAKERLALPFELIEDSHLALAKGLGLPVFSASGETLYSRITLVIEDGVIEKVFFPIDDPSENAKAVLDYLKQRA